MIVNNVTLTRKLRIVQLWYKIDHWKGELEIAILQFVSLFASP